MRVWVRTLTRVHEGIGPGFPDTKVISGVEVFDHEVTDSVECDVIVAHACTCTAEDFPYADKLGLCVRCGGSMETRPLVTQSRTARRNELRDGQPSTWQYWLDPPADTKRRCPSMHGGQQCQWFTGHLGPHQECNEVWSHD